jgi:molecular chaperone Hsp33
VALTALLGAALKFEGKFILQASTDGPVDLLVADYQVPGSLRGYARFSAERLAELPANGRLLGEGHLAMTIDRGVDTERYQGVVPLEGESLTEAADTYFRQSEQLPTFIRLAVARHYRAGSAGGVANRCSHRWGASAASGATLCSINTGTAAPRDRGAVPLTSVPPERPGREVRRRIDASPRPEARADRFRR